MIASGSLESIVRRHSLISVNIFPSRFFPLHFFGSKTLGFFRDIPIPQIRSLGLDSTRILPAVSRSSFLNFSFWRYWNGLNSRAERLKIPCEHSLRSSLSLLLCSISQHRILSLSSLFSSFPSEFLLLKCQKRLVYHRKSLKLLIKILFRKQKPPDFWCIKYCSVQENDIPLISSFSHFQKLLKQMAFV